MDPFEVRMQFLTLLHRLNASQQSIQKVVGYALKYFSKCGEDLWECIIEECQKGTINNRINILYFIDSLCEACLQLKSQSASISGLLYVDYLGRDLSQLVEAVVPKGREGLPNLISAKQILENWRSKRVVDPHKIDEVVGLLDGRAGPTFAAVNTPTSSTLSRNEVFKRIEEDRERHKRLRERRWVQPVANQVGAPVPTLASFLPLSGGTGHGSVESLGTEEGTGGWNRGEELTIDIEFENEWETTSDWNEDDDEAVMEENELCFPSQRSIPMDVP